MKVCVIVFFVDFYVCPTIMVPYPATPHSRVAHRYLGTPSLPNENLKYLKTVLKSTVGSERVNRDQTDCDREWEHEEINISSGSSATAAAYGARHGDWSKQNDVSGMCLKWSVWDKRLGWHIGMQLGMKTHLRDQWLRSLKNKILLWE